MKKLRSVRLSVLAASLLTLAVMAMQRDLGRGKRDTRENVKTTGEGLENRLVRAFKS